MIFLDDYDEDDGDEDDGDDVPEDHVLDGGRECGNVPGDVGLPAAPGLREVLHDHPGLVLLDALRHHVHDVEHHGGPQLEVVVAAGALLGDGVEDGGAGPGALVPALEVPR